MTIRHTRPGVAFRTRETSGLVVDRLSVTIDDPEPHGDDAPACVALDGSGVIGSLQLGWPGAPPDWNAIDVSDSGSPVVIKALQVRTRAS